jgi:hypothetical protein
VRPWAGSLAILVTLLGADAVGAETRERVILQGRVESRIIVAETQLILNPTHATWSSVANFEVLHSGEVTLRFQGNSVSRFGQKQLSGRQMSAATYEFIMEGKLLAFSSGTPSEVRFYPGVQKPGGRASLKFRMAESDLPIDATAFSDVLNVIVVLA